CHMPDTLEMPYRAEIFGASVAYEKTHTYRLGGLTCLAGDVMGDYSFDRPLEIGQRLMFDDMAHYTMVKTTTFNGTKLPAIAIWNSETDDLRIVREFGYEDFKSRLS
ncbi:MAG: carboxynorspermidine decarboxylase, partial [Cyanobacteria bacterium J06648_11]